MNQLAFDRFSVVYRAALQHVVAADPGYVVVRRGAETATEAVERCATAMLHGIANTPMQVNYNGKAMALACKELGIKHTRRAILEFIGL